MEFKDLLIASCTGIFLSILIGPIFFMLIQTSVTKGVKAALAFNFGACFTDIIYVIISFYFSFKILKTINEQPLFYLIGGFIMIIYGLILILKRETSVVNSRMYFESRTNLFQMFLKGFMLNVINFGIFGFWFIVVLLVQPTLQNEISRIISFFSVVFISYMLADLPKILLAKKLKNRLTPNNILIMKRATGTVILLFGVALVFQIWFPSDQDIIKKFMSAFGIS